MNLLKIHLLSMSAFFVMSSCHSNFLSPADMATQAFAIDKQLIYSFNESPSGNVDGFMRNYWNSPELIVIDVTKTFRGYEAWRDEITKQLKSRGPNKFVYTESNNSVQGSYVLGSGKWQYIVPNEAGEPEITNGIYTDVKAIRNGRLVLISSHFSRICPSGKSE